MFSGFQDERPDGQKCAEDVAVAEVVRSRLITSSEIGSGYDTGKARPKARRATICAVFLFPGVRGIEALGRRRLGPGSTAGSRSEQRSRPTLPHGRGVPGVRGSGFVGRREMERSGMERTGLGAREMMIVVGAWVAELVRFAEPQQHPTPSCPLPPPRPRLRAGR